MDYYHERNMKTSQREEFLSAACPETLIDVCRLKQLFQNDEFAPDDMRIQLHLIMECKTDNASIGTRSCQKKSKVHTETVMTSKESYKDNDIEESRVDSDNDQIKKLTDELQLLDEQIKSNAVSALDLSEDQTKKYESFESKWLRSSSTYMKLDRPVGKRNQYQKMKVLLFFGLILFVLNPVAASPTQTNYETTGLYEYKRLQTSPCNYTDFLNTELCDLNEAVVNIYIKYCGLAALCGPGFKPVCANSDNGEKLYFCSPKDLVCPKGYWRRASRKATDPNMVLVREEKCPTGRYQPHKSDCYDACRTGQEDIKSPPLQYVIYSKGDNISPPMIYCNFKRGFYSLDGKFLQKYDEEIRFKHLICTSVTDYNPCSGEMYPIPNGTCVFPCGEGFERDVYDDFLCKQLRWSETDSRKEEIHRTNNDFSQKTEESADINVPYRTLLNLGTETKYEDSRIPYDWHVSIVKVLVIAALLLALVGLVFVLLEH